MILALSYTANGSLLCSNAASFVLGYVSAVDVGYVVP
ncbi:unannotated protein [freshwater metagenome]|uniref:Unannotated protein n=1 Tax=freshwater metagenome TaxID=449393 RepID=A0A6J6UZ07_9ZZZZ